MSMSLFASDKAAEIEDAITLVSLGFSTETFYIFSGLKRVDSNPAMFASDDSMYVLDANHAKWNDKSEAASSDKDHVCLFYSKQSGGMRVGGVGTSRELAVCDDSNRGRSLCTRHI